MLTEDCFYVPVLTTQSGIYLLVQTIVDFQNVYSDGVGLADAVKPVPRLLVQPWHPFHLDHEGAAAGGEGYGGAGGLDVTDEYTAVGVFLKLLDRQVSPTGRGLPGDHYGSKLLQSLDQLLRYLLVDTVKADLLIYVPFQ
jgi:hypothetical protein